MKVYRIAKKDFINDLTGEGSRLYGGRWNKKGTRVLYTAESRSLATVEYLVHLSLQIVPTDIYIAEIELPNAESEEIDYHTLPDDWQCYPAPTSLAEIGEKWIKNSRTLFLKVPSVVIKNEWNIIINPNHKYFNKVTINNVEQFFIDSRLVSR
jgi:RES domain-containing protein